MRAKLAAVTLSFVAIATSGILEAAPLRLTEYIATLAGRDGRKVTGAAAARPASDGKSTDITVSIDGDTPGATRPWHVHSGSCTKSGGVVGGGRAYAAIVIDTKGQGKGTATIPVLLADTVTYYVNIHDAATAMGIIVACGDLARR